MNNNFAHTITLLRKEKKLTQKEAAQSLGISQALLSHYEKGIRECSLSFVVKAAEFYDVSCDYLLGKTAERQYDITDLNDNTSTSSKQNASHMVNRRLLDNTAGIIYDCLAHIGNRKLTRSVTNYLMTAEYKVFRLLCGSGQAEKEGMFTIPKNIYLGYTTAAQEKLFTDIINLCDRSGDDYIQKLEELDFTPEQITEEYPEAAGSLFNVIQHAENTVNKIK